MTNSFLKNTKRLGMIVISIWAVSVLMKTAWSFSQNKPPAKVEATQGLFPVSNAKLSDQILIKTDYSSRRNDSAWVKELQQGLKNAGFDPGAIDGMMGSKTKRALMNFKVVNNLPRDSEINDETMMELNRYFEISASKRR